MVGCPVDPVGLARAAQADTLVLNFRYVNRELVDTAHQQDIKVMRLEYRRSGNPQALPGHEPGRYLHQSAPGDY